MIHVMVSRRATALEAQLIHAEEAVTAGTEHVNRQCQILAELEEGGHRTHLAEGLLSVFKESLALHVADRDRIKQGIERLTHD
ncbi:MAG: hypothetical protein JO188_21735 [Hyphomicrobiales bacterium]|nr:hypothetical protein [Hyphomicrobiales bacterium]